MRRVAAVLGIAASLVLGAAPSWASVPAREAKVPNVKAMLLAIDQMPAGWSVTRTGGGGGVKGCVAPKISGAKVVSSGSVAFAKGGNLPEVAESIAAFRVPIAKRFTQMVNRLSACCRRSSKFAIHSHRSSRSS